jgi:fatty acid desaturase
VTAMYLPLGFYLIVSLSLLLRFIDTLYYSDDERVLQFLNLKKNNKLEIKKSYYKKYDHLFATFCFIWSWLDIYASALIISKVSNSYLPFVSILAILFVGSRFRALQEASHTAVHYGLCKSKKWQWTLSNIFFQYPCFKPDIYYRYIAHVLEHHPHANELEKDPNIIRFIFVGLTPGISEKEFYWKLFYPLTFAGFKETLQSMFKNYFSNKEVSHAIVRFSVIISLVSSLYILFGWKGLLITYLLPLLTTYPLFSWISVLVEHRWFVNCNEQDRRTRECINGRPTDYNGFTGWIIKNALFPGTDHYHLVHSLYPFVRWNYMKAIDMALKEQEPAYTKFLSQGLLFSNGTTPSALSELRDRITNLDALDLAVWAKEIRKNSHGIVP